MIDVESFISFFNFSFVSQKVTDGLSYVFERSMRDEMTKL